MNHTHSILYLTHFPLWVCERGGLWLNPNLILQLCSASILTQPLCQEVISRWGLIWRWTLILDGWIKREDRHVAVERERTTMSQKNRRRYVFPAVEGDDGKPANVVFQLLEMRVRRGKQPSFPTWAQKQVLVFWHHTAKLQTLIVNADY